MRDLNCAATLARHVVLVAALALAGRPANAQPVQATADRVLWELASWPGVDSSGAPLTQLQTHEDWFYSITQSRTALGAQDGFVAAGYSRYPDVTSTTCRSSCGGLPCALATISKISPAGEVEWFDHNDAEGSFWRVIDTEDGGYLAVGHSHDRPLFEYNPVNSVGTVELECSPGSEADYRLMTVARFSHDGTRQWQYAYGQMDNPNDYLPTIGTQVQTEEDFAWDAVERPNGGFRVVGRAVDPEHDMNPRAFVMDLASDGSLIESRTFGIEGQRSEFMGITRSGDDYYIVGAQYDGSFEEDPYGDVFVLRLGDELKDEPLAGNELIETEGEQDTGYDVAIAGDGTIHVAAIIDCDAVGGRGDCFRSQPGGTGDAVVYQFDPLDLALLSTTELGEVLAYDLFIRLTELSDGRIGFVSTVQPTVPDPTPQGWEAWWYTDALVGILAEDGEVDWWTRHDARTSMQYFNGRQKHQECLYDIAEAEDGGLAVSGNNSSHYDDNYVIRFAIDEVPALTAPAVSHSHLVFPVLGLTPNTVSISGDLTVAPSARLWIDSGRTLAFEEADTLLVRGEMVMVEATLTAEVQEDEWAGIVAAEGEVSLTGGLVEFAGTALTVFEEAVATVTRTTLARSKLGLGVFSQNVTVLGATIEENGTGIETDYTAPYGGPPGCLLSCPSLLVVDWDASTTTRTSVSGNDSDGVNVLNATLEMRSTDVEDNGGVGVRLANATASPFRLNVVAGNGGAGISVQAAGFVDLSLATQQGQNTLFENDGTELFISVTGDGFVGDDEANGHNDIVDNRFGAGLLVSYQYDPFGGEPVPLAAEYVYWGYTTTGGPPGSRIEGEVDAVPSLECPFANPGCASFGPGGGAGALAAGLSAGGDVGFSLRGRGERIREIRGWLAADPTNPLAPAWIRALGSLHWHDREDATGERAATFELLATLSEPLRVASVPTGYRPAAEAALLVRALAALRREEYALGRDLVNLEHEVENVEVRRRLSVVDAFLDAQGGGYMDASATLAAASVATASTEEAAELMAISRSFGARALSRAQGVAGLTASVTSGVTEPRFGLRISPNPAGNVATVAFTLARSGPVQMSVHDVIGRLVLRIPEQYLEAGSHTWTVRASELPAGTYLVRVEQLSSVPREGLARMTVIR